uniref:Enoyl reductase C646.07c n=1 Tax=Dermatophagoides pteronyssinus TaxID=6956 RepID=A0A6P6XXZ6_DERPT|nr:putative enoyl reductase C646.07c [Dermatophagoides pteronyssinus]
MYKNLTEKFYEKLIKPGPLAPQFEDDPQVLVFKDLGLQISWRLVFVLEYLGPLFIFPAMQLLHGATKLDHARLVAFWLLMLHFFKREVESLFVHRFSKTSMPIIRLPINCFHYWVICAGFVGYFLFHPQYVSPWRHNRSVVDALALVFLFCEFMNAKTHLILRNLRTRCSSQKGIPSGAGFDLVSCANYFWEICAWATYAALVGSLPALVFVLVSAVQMHVWAKRKHKLYLAEFPHYPK